ncbi:ArsR/SmtB family transcription factor [Pseudarthrobacter albicanus]|uniref:ArsR/SmtB family transcription factor n=1 Tax=Pseudarthrobacter albicanus TaxID=2823873 RepID=UPI0027DB26C9|nr:metalloregulator ArsR/SmtB family transcription factor [Pseudarthrobacter albicanus]
MNDDARPGGGLHPPVAIFAALGDPARQRLLELLGIAGAATATTLAEPLGVTRQAVAKHLEVLKAAGLVESKRSGKQVLYSVRREPLDQTAAWLASAAKLWDTRLAAIKRAAEQ